MKILASHLPGKPSDPPDDVHLIHQALIGRIMSVVRNDAHLRWIAVGNVLQPFRYKPHTVMKNEDTGRRWHASASIDQHHVAAVEGRRHAVPFHMHDPQVGGIRFEPLLDP